MHHDLSKDFGVDCNLSIKLAVTLLHADRQHKANSRFLVTAVSVDISRNTLSFSCIMTLARVLESIVKMFCFKLTYNFNVSFN